MGGCKSRIHCLCRCQSVDFAKAASYGVYLAYYLANDYFPDGDAFDYAMIGGLEFAVALLLAPLVTIIARRLGTRWTMMIGAVVHACGFIAASFASTILHLYWTQGVMIGIGISFLFVSIRRSEQENLGEALNCRRYHRLRYFHSGSIGSAH